MVDRLPPGHVGQLSRLIYVDDSGSVDFGGLIVYGWVEVAPAEWAQGLRHWLDLRKELYRDFRVPTSRELHATQFVNGRSRISLDAPQAYRHGPVQWKNLGRDVAVRCLSAVRDCPHLRVGAVYTHEPTGGTAYTLAKYRAYADFVAGLDAQLQRDDTYAVVTMDGDDPHYRDAHRALRLDGRHLIEDPFAHDSRVSQWTQIADLVAYCANLHLNRHPRNEFGWSWYTDYLTPRDPHGLPRRL